MAEEPAIVEAARRSGADTMIEALPQGYDTPSGRLGDEAQELSTGQWQKIAIARAYLRHAGLLVLDEPTSALDALAEREVYRQFLELAQDRAVLLISHRLGSFGRPNPLYAARTHRRERHPRSALRSNLKTPIRQRAA